MISIGGVSFAMAAFTMVADAPLESVITILLLLKSIAVSNIILSPALLDELSVPFKTISSNPESSVS